MAFAVADFHDLVRLLEEHPEWRGELRRLLLTDDILELPKIVGELAAAQQRTEARIEQLAEAQRRTEARIEQLAEAQQRTEARIEQLAEAQQRTEARIEQLAEAQQRTEARIQQLAETLQRTDAQLAQLTGRVDQVAASTDRLVQVAVVVERDIGELKGFMLEERYRSHAPAYFSPLLRRMRILSAQQLADLADDAEERDLIADRERLSLLAADVVLSGVRRADRQEVYFAVEVSWIIDGHDVERAAERAGILARVTGKPGVAVVAGRSMSDRAIARARELNVLQVLDGAAALLEHDLQSA
ncbi:MAG TPA: hypothetical protein VMW56_11620 [Candidatus Margulisiibacteriota bacterium]|nr:hypothetical protein [Candidatus Margulisiibacteriota bacterium]